MNFIPKFNTFHEAITSVESALRDAHHRIHPNKWQSIDVSMNKQAEMAEVLDISFQVIGSQCSLGKIIEDIRPNLEWADEHFSERVGGRPLNPPPSSQRWPFIQNQNAQEFLETNLRDLDERDWAYLAAFIDADGSITLHQRNSAESTKRPRISISQKNFEFIRWLKDKYKLGVTTERKRRQRLIVTGKMMDTESAIWFVTRKAEVKYILSKILPYLRQKKDKALLALEVLETLPDHYAQKPSRYTELPVFSHSYPERLWPKYASNAESIRYGIRFPYGDLMDVITHLVNDRFSRQGFINIWNHEDTGVVHRKRVPCTLGYHFICRKDRLHCTYYIRSCDFYRHFRDDLYLTIRLQVWVLERLRELDPWWNEILRGNFTFHCVSMHCFRGDFQKLFKRDI